VGILAARRRHAARYGRRDVVERREEASERVRIAKGARQLAGHGLQPGLRASAVEADEVLELDLRAGVALGDGRHAERSSGTRAAIELHDERPAEQRAPLD